MTLQVFTARITYGGADALDITRKTADRDPAAPGRWWAPSWSIVREAKAGLAACHQAAGTARAGEG